MTPYYKQLVLARERIIRSEMYIVDPTCVDRTLDDNIEETNDCWNEYYAIYSTDAEGDYYELVEDGYDFKEIVASYKNRLYDLYKENFDPAEGEPVCYAEWEANDFREIIKEMFGSLVEE